MQAAAHDERTIRIAQLPAVSPSSAEMLRSCMLRAGFAASTEASKFTLGNPKAWLGTAYHEVLALATRTPANELSQRLPLAWDAAVSKQQRFAMGHPLNARFGTPEKWPGYHLTFALAAERAKELCEEQRPKTDTGLVTDGETSSEKISEKRFQACGGLLIGKPDLLRNGMVIDFKTGSVVEDQGSEQIKLAYIRQLRIYAFLVHEVLGWWPSRGLLLPMDGAPVEVDLQPETCTAEAGEALTLLWKYNDLVSKALNPEEIASPSPVACRWCQYQLICAPFWREAGPTWEAELHSVAVSGELISDPERLQSGAYSFTLEADAGSIQPGKVTIPQVEPNTCAAVTGATAPARLRATGLSRRRDGSIAATSRAVMLSVSDIPRVTFAERSAANG